MRHWAGCVQLMFLLAAVPGYGAESDASANALAEAMRQARYSEGFEARLNVFVTQASGAHPAPFKLAVIGQWRADRQRLLIRGISPESVRDRFIAAERGSDGRIRAVSYRAGGASKDIEPEDALFGSGLVVWDMFGPWWGWCRQVLDGIDRVSGRECEKIRSYADAKDGAVREVESCVDRQAKLSLRTRLFDARHELLRSTSVGRLMRKDNGAQAAKKMTIDDAARLKTEIEVYAGDEEYQVGAETFAALEHLSKDARQEAR